MWVRCSYCSNCNLSLDYRCNFCDQTSSRRWNIEKHVQRKHDVMFNYFDSRGIRPRLYEAIIRTRRASDDKRSSPFVETKKNIRKLNDDELYHISAFISRIQKIRKKSVYSDYGQFL